MTTLRLSSTTSTPPHAVSEDDLPSTDDSQSEDGEDPELTLLIFGNRILAKRSELIERFDLDGLPDGCIISIAPTEQLANQQLAEAKEGTENHRTPNARHAGSASAGRRSSLTNQLGGSVSLTQTDCRARSPHQAWPALMRAADGDIGGTLKQLEHPAATCGGAPRQLCLAFWERS